MTCYKGTDQSKAPDIAAHKTELRLYWYHTGHMTCYKRTDQSEAPERAALEGAGADHSLL